MSHKSPLEVVNDTFGGKDKLVDKLVGLLESDEPKEELRKRLLAVANSKLVRLHGVASAVKEKFGSREKMLETVVGTRAKDKDYRTKFEGYTTPRLLDAARMAERRTKAASAPAKARAPKAAKPAVKAAA